MADASRDQLILDHLDLVRHVVGRLVSHLPVGCDRENLESAGVLGLVEAAQHYQPQREAAFATFAYPRIRGAVLDELRRNSPLPQRVLKNIRRVREASERSGPAATVEQLAQAANLTAEEVDEALEAARLSRIQQSGGPVPWLHGLPDGGAPSPSDALEQQELQGALADAIDRLPERERLVLILYHLEDLRLKEIGAVVQLSESRVSRLLSRAENRLEELLRTRLEGRIALEVK